MNARTSVPGLVLAVLAGASLASAQPQPPAQPARRTRPVAPKVTTIDANIESIGFRDEAGWRTVFVKLRVVRARGFNPPVDYLAPAPQTFPPTTAVESPGVLRQHNAFRGGENTWLAYRCRVLRNDPRGCGVATNHPTALSATGRVTFQLIATATAPDESPLVPPIPRTGPPQPGPGPTFRLLADGMVQAQVIQVQDRDPGQLQTTGPMIIQ